MAAAGRFGSLNSYPFRRIFHAMMRLLLLCVLVIFSGEAGPTRSDPGGMELPSVDPAIDVSGEELIYEVRWGMFDLGTVMIRGTGPRSARAWIDSYENLPFVDLHSVYTTVMDSLFFSRGALTLDKGDGGWAGFRYTVDSLGGQVFVDRVAAAKPVDQPEHSTRFDTIEPGTPRFVDGLSIGYMPRLFVRTRQRLDVPTILNGKLGVTTFFFDGRTTHAEIEALESPVRVVEVRGTTNAEGIYGMTGDFVGWFSDDAAAVPIKGELKVLIGSVTVELVRWKGGGWSPPVVGG